MNTRTLWILLSISLAVNVFLVGAFVGARLSGGHIRPAVATNAPDPRSRNPVAAAIRELSPEAQAAWRAQSRDFAAQVGPGMREARNLSQAAMRGIGEPDFNPETARANLERARALELEGRTEMDRRLVAFAQTLSPSDRTRLAKALVRSRKPRDDGPPR